MTAAPPQKNKEKQKNSRKILEANSIALMRRLVSEYLKPYTKKMILALFFMLIAAGMTAAIAGLMQPVLDDVLYGGKEGMIIPVAFALFIVFSLRGISTYLHTIFMNIIGQSIVADIQSQLFAKFMRMEMAFFNENPSGQLISRVVNDVTVVRSAVTDTLTNLGKSILTLIFLIAVMLYRDWQLTIAAFVVFPFLSFFVIYIGRRLRKTSKNIQSELGGLSDLLSQNFLGVRVVKAYGMEEKEVARVTQRMHAVRDLNIESVRLGSLSTPVNDVIVGLIVSLIITYGGYAVLNGHTTPGSLASFISAFILAYEPMKKLAKLNNNLQMGLGAAERIFDMLDRDIGVSDNRDAQELNADSIDIEFKDVSFVYANSDLKALNSISFKAKSGQVTALVGPSGGGKSTVLNLIPRFFDVSSGEINFNESNVGSFSQESLRQHIALVSQDITIFNDSVFENIRYGSPHATLDDVISAAKKAAAHDFIEGLEDGYETIVGEGGGKLSGGQKQRISIARAILRDAPILLLDEATSALDNESERLIQDALKALQKGRTTLVIAHRLSTIQDADQILVMNEGRIEEQGTHEALLSKNGLYASMYHNGVHVDA